MKDVPEKDRRYSLRMTLMGKQEFLINSKSYPYCLMVRKDKENLIQFKDASFEIVRVL